MKNLLLFKKLKFTCLLANSTGIQELSRWRRLWGHIAWCLWWMLRCSEEGGNLVLAEGREFLYPEKMRSWKREESREAEHFFLMAVTLHLKNPKRKSSVWKEISVRKFFHRNLHLLCFRNTTFWSQKLLFMLSIMQPLPEDCHRAPWTQGKGLIIHCNL